MSYVISSSEPQTFLENVREKLFRFRSRQKLSAQISIIYALILLATMILTSIGTTAGVWYLFHHQAARALDISVELTEKKVRKLSSIDENFFASGAVVTGVIFRVTDEKGNLILDNAPGFAPIEKLLRDARKDPPFWSSSEYQLIETPRSFFYHKDLPLEVGGKIFHFHFFKAITFEKEFIRYLLWVLLLANLIGVSFALMSGYFLSRRALRPLRQMTQAAREISAGNLDRRIDVQKSGDEVSELAESFNKMLGRLEESFTRQQRFVADASHEFRTPITIIRGYSEMLEKYGAEDSEILTEAAAAIKISSQNMQSLIESLLFLARADQNILPLSKKNLEVNELLKSLVESYNSPRVEFIQGKTFEIFGDKDFLEKMFREIIDNALRYSEGKVRVECDSSSVKIIDSGIGIAEENLEKIFDRFFRADKSRTNIGEEKISAGLGLSIAKWIADKHGIKIEISSELGKGTTVTCKITS